MPELIIIIVALTIAASVGGIIYVVRNPLSARSLLLNPRQHLFGKSDYVADDSSGMLYEVDWDDMVKLPDGFIRYTDHNPFPQNSYVVIVNRDNEVIYGMGSDEIWPTRAYRDARDDVMGYRAMTDDEIIDHEKFLEDRP